MDPVGFEPTIFSLQRRRLTSLGHGPPRMPRRHRRVPTRGLEPPHPVRAIDPKSTASTCSATSAPAWSVNAADRIEVTDRIYPRFCSCPRKDTCCHLSQVGITHLANKNLSRNLFNQLRRDSAKAESTHLAPSCTLAQPHPSLNTLVGSYPTLSPLTLRNPACGSALCCGCSQY